MTHPNQNLQSELFHNINIVWCYHCFKRQVKRAIEYIACWQPLGPLIYCTFTQTYKYVPRGLVKSNFNGYAVYFHCETTISRPRSASWVSCSTHQRYFISEINPFHMNMTVDINCLLLNCPGKCEVTIIPWLCRSSLNCLNKDSLPLSGELQSKWKNPTITEGNST